jgi:hypothetical protein
MMDKIMTEAYLAVETINETINYNLWSDDFISKEQLKRMEWVSHHYLLEFLSTGDLSCIEFLGQQIWSSENDEREYNDDKDDYAESIEKFVYSKMLRIIHDLQLIEKCLIE